MPEAICCVECGTPLPAYWPRGLCAQCAFGGALDMTNAGSQVFHPEPPAVPLGVQPPPFFQDSAPMGSFGDYELLEEIAHDVRIDAGRHDEGADPVDREHAQREQDPLTQLGDPTDVLDASDH